jgi:hypothetical protein
MSCVRIHVAGSGFGLLVFEFRASDFGAEASGLQCHDPRFGSAVHMVPRHNNQHDGKMVQIKTLGVERITPKMNNGA